MNEKTYEERLDSLKKGCIILCALQILSAISAIYSLISGKGGNIITVIFSVVLLAMLYFIYKYTAERNPLGPTLETIYGIILLIDGILLLFTLIGFIFGVIYIILAIGILKEAKYFRTEIKNNKGNNEESNIEINEE